MLKTLHTIFVLAALLSIVSAQCSSLPGYYCYGYECVNDSLCYSNNCIGLSVDSIGRCFLSRSTITWIVIGACLPFIACFLCCLSCLGCCCFNKRKTTIINSHDYRGVDHQPIINIQSNQTNHALNH